MRMNVTKWMGWSVVLAVAFLGVSCTDYGPNGKTDYQAPLLSGSNDAKDRVDLRGAIEFGASLEDAFSANKMLTGFVLQANPGARLTLSATSADGEDPVLLVYGPQDDKGIWGQAIAVDDDGKGGLDSLISDFALPSGGRFLVAVAEYNGDAGGDFNLLVGCRGNCTEPACPDVLCDLYCPNGFMTDANGCPVCVCVEGECATDEDCVYLYPWATGVPVCLEGRCVFNDLYCDDVTPCPAGFVCEINACPAMPCDENGFCPPCSGICVPDSTGCLDDASCGPGFVCLNGVCVPEAMECSDNTQCPEGMECVMVCNGGAICDSATDPNCAPVCDPTTDPGCSPPCDPNVDPGCGTCVSQCVPVQPPSCDEATPCPEGYECIMECWTCDPNWPDCGCDPATGQDCARCVGTCVPVQPVECWSDQDCIFPNGEVGYCLNGQCVFDQITCSDGTVCPPGMICVEVCTDCDPADPDCVPGCVGYCVPDQPVECYSDYDCIDSAGQLGRCVEGRCVFGGLECTADWGCPPGYRCDLLQCLPDCDSTTGNCCVGVCVPDGQVYCNSDEECFAADGQMGRCVNGQCVFNGCLCPDVWAPVCGADGVTYPNDCYAACAGVPVAFYGECGTEPLNCFSDGECPAGMYCEFCATSNPDGSCSDIGMCLPLPYMICEQDADCPQGFTCVLTCDAGPFCDPAVDPNCSPTCDPTTDPNCTTTCVGQCVPLETGCIRTGCSGEVCAPFPVNTTCVWLPEYACLQFTTCQALYTSDGQMTCGFEQTQEYLDCLLQITNPPTCENGMTCPDGMICQTFCDAAGICQTGCFASDCVCPEIYDPVCGMDGVTYENVCQLSCADVEFAYAGTCDQARP